MDIDCQKRELDAQRPHGRDARKPLVEARELRCVERGLGVLVGERAQDAVGKLVPETVTP